MVAAVQAMAGGDKGAGLAKFYDRFAGSTMGLILRILRSQAEAEELHQEVFMELWRRAPEFDPGRGSVSAWVARVARSRAIDRVRARNRRGAGKHVSEDGVELASSGSPPDEVVAQRRRSAQIHDAMGRLTDVQKQVLELSYFGGLSHGEIASKLELPLGTVKSRILAAMRTLRRALVPAHGGAA